MRDVWTQEENYGDRRIDLEVPIIYTDNLLTQNRIVVPDSDNFASYFDVHLGCKIKFDLN